MTGAHAVPVVLVRAAGGALCGASTTRDAFAGIAPARFQPQQHWCLLAVAPDHPRRGAQQHGWPLWFDRNVRFEA